MHLFEKYDLNSERLDINAYCMSEGKESNRQTERNLISNHEILLLKITKKKQNE